MKEKGDKKVPFIIYGGDIIKKTISLITAIVMFATLSFAADRAYSTKPEAAQSDDYPITSIVEYVGGYALDVFCDAMHLIEIALYRFDFIFSFLYGVENKTVEVKNFAWNNEAPVLAENDSSAFGCTMSLGEDVNFLELTSDITSWYEYSREGLFWSEVKTDYYYTFVRNKLWQDYLYNADDSSVSYGWLGGRSVIPSGTRFKISFTGDASDRMASVYNLDAGTVYYIRLCMYIRTDDAHVLYKSEPLRCVR